MRFGIHAGPQDCSIDDLRRLWRLADDHGLELFVRDVMPAFR